MTTPIRPGRPRVQPRSPRAAGRRRPPARLATDPRFSRRRKAIVRSRNRRILLRLSIGAVVLLSPWVLFASPLLRVRAVEVTGAEHTEIEEVVRAAQLDNGDNLLLLSADEVIGKVRALPWVSSVELDRMLPGTVRIRIEERRPALILSLGAARWTLDAHGRVLDSGTVASDLPVLAGVQVGTVSPGVDLKTAEATGALRVWRSLPAGLAEDVEAVFAPTVERITVVLSDGTQVRYGAPENMAAKNEVLRALRKQLAADGSLATYIDIRVPSRPAVAAQAPEDSLEAAAPEDPQASVSDH
jgi:cell division protein FtsQ